MSDEVNLIFFEADFRNDGEKLRKRQKRDSNWFQNTTKFKYEIEIAIFEFEFD